VNRQPVAGRYALKSGDRLEVGGTLFLFRERSRRHSAKRLANRGSQPTFRIDRAPHHDRFDLQLR